MIYINEIKDSNNSFALVRTDNDVFEKDFIVTSKNENNSDLPFSVEIVSSSLIKAYTFECNKLKIIADTPNIKNDEYVILINSAKERLKINIKPNDYFVMERKYKFKITREYIDKDKSLKLKILSKVNDMEVGWTCTYMGQPISYNVFPLNSNESCYVTISNEQGTIIFNDFYSTFVFEQKESGNIIEYKLHNTQNGIVIDKDKK